jgi:exonuclease V gamma subunit
MPIFTHPGSRILNLGFKKQQQQRGAKKKFVAIPFFVATNFTKLNYFIFEMRKKKNWANFQRIIELFTQNIVTRVSKIWAWERGSMGSGIPIRNTAQGTMKSFPHMLSQR